MKPVADSLKKEAENFKKDNKTFFEMSNFEAIESRNSCCDQNKECCSPTFWHDLLQKTRKRTRS